MKSSVFLSSLPEGIVFPESLAGRVAYDPRTQQLSFEGFMSKTEFDSLSRLSNELAYQRALEALFQKCTFRRPPAAGASTEPHARHTIQWLLAAVTAGAAIALATVVILLRH